MHDALLDPLKRSAAGIRTDDPALIILQLGYRYKEVHKNVIATLPTLFQIIMSRKMYVCLPKSIIKAL